MRGLAQMARDGSAAVAQRQSASAPRSNSTGLPDPLKKGVEALSGVSLDGLKVHYNSAHPAQLGALAYAQGTDIHLARGQEQHLPHEAWHVAQQAQGRVRPTMQMKDGVPVNDDPGLEQEADVMGARALQMIPGPQVALAAQLAVAAPVIQRVVPGLEFYVAPDRIPAEWVVAYIADIEQPTTHLYQADLETYLSSKNPNWREVAALTWAGNHWDVTFIGSGVVVKTRPDGNCGAYAIHAILTNDGSKPRDNYDEAPSAVVVDVRRWAKAQIVDDAKEIRTRIAQEIRDCDSVAETGFGDTLSAILTPIQQQAALQNEREQLQRAELAALAHGLGGGRSDSSSSPDAQDLIVGETRTAFGSEKVPDLVVDASAPPKAKADEFALHVERIRLRIQKMADSLAPGKFTCVVRFNVKDKNVGDTHPGINSWAHLAKAKGASTQPAESLDRAKLAQQHMDYGHDVGKTDKSKDPNILQDSPFVSGSDDATALIKADSPFNPARAKALIQDAGINDQRARGGPGFGPSRSLIPKSFGKSAPDKGPAKTAGKFVSDRIVFLTHGFDTQIQATALKLPVATHVSFILAPNDRVHRPAEGTDKDMCCVLEHEVTIFAPDIDLANFVIFEIKNLLPELLGRFR